MRINNFKVLILGLMVASTSAMAANNTPSVSIKSVAAANVVSVDNCSIDDNDTGFSFCNPVLMGVYQKHLTTKPNFNKTQVLLRIPDPRYGMFFYAAVDTKTKQVYTFPYEIGTASRNKKVPSLSFSLNSNRICSTGNDVIFEGNGYSTKSIDDTMSDVDLCTSLDVNDGFRSWFDITPAKKK